MKFTIDQETTTNIVELLMSCDYDFSRITIADYATEEEGLALLIEDRQNPGKTFADCLKVTISYEEFEQFITLNKLNTYKGTLTKDGGKILPSDVVINEPFAWYEIDATEYQRTNCREDILKSLLENLTK